MNRRLPILISAALVLMLAAGICMGIFWLPDMLAYMRQFLPGAPLGWICAVIAVPFFAIVLAAFAFPGAVSRDSMFSPETAKLILRISIALLLDCMGLAATALWLLCAGESLLSPVLLFVALIGLIVALMLGILSRYVQRAAILNEEVEATL